MEEERILGDPMGEHCEVPQRGPARYGTGCIAAVWAGLFGGGQPDIQPADADTVGTSACRMGVVLILRCATHLQA